MVSPSGETMVVGVPGRERPGDENLRVRGSDASGRWNPVVAKRQDRQFRRLLSAGWVVAANGDGPTEKGRDNNGLPTTSVGAGKEAKKNTPRLVGTSKTGDASHGGKHASREVEDSPNAAKRGCRGGQKQRRRDPYERNRRKALSSAPSPVVPRGGGRSGYVHQELHVSRGLLESAEQSAELLKELVGKSQLKTRRGITTDAEKLLVALEIGDNPIPALEAPDERPRLRVIVSPDCSGSTQIWSGLGKAWALHLAKLPETDVYYIRNANGEFLEGSAAECIERADALVYLGDGDGYNLCRQYAEQGAVVLALDCYCASLARPRLLESRDNFYWVDRVSANVPATWKEGLRICLERARGSF